MHVNDVYALRSLLKAVKKGMTPDPGLVDALLEAANDEVEAFEKHLEELALREEASQY